ncbi:hypothetical protein [Falsibacillus albus]|nr:hypothetical protein [Falsibacillus albus]
MEREIKMNEVIKVQNVSNRHLYIAGEYYYKYNHVSLFKLFKKKKKESAE